MGWTPVAIAATENSSAANMLLVSVTATAGIRDFTQRSTSFFTGTAPFQELDISDRPIGKPVAEPKRGRIYVGGNQQGLQAAQEMMQRQAGQLPGRGNRDRMDPMGRPVDDDGPGANAVDSSRIDLGIDKDAQQRAREIFDELRQRRNDPSRPKPERDYLDRLLHLLESRYHNRGGQDCFHLEIPLQVPTHLAEISFAELVALRGRSGFRQQLAAFHQALDALLAMLGSLWTAPLAAGFGITASSHGDEIVLHRASDR